MSKGGWRSCSSSRRTFWTKKDLGVWSIPKGEYAGTEQAPDAAIRELRKRPGFQAVGPFLELGSAKQPGGKVVTAWGFEGDCDPSQLTSNLIRMEWPPKSSRQIVFAEVDRASWFTMQEARERILKGQAPLLQSLEDAMREKNVTIAEFIDSDARCHHRALPALWLAGRGEWEQAHEITQPDDHRDSS